MANGGFGQVVATDAEGNAVHEVCHAIANGVFGDHLLALEMVVKLDEVGIDGFVVIGGAEEIEAANRLAQLFGVLVGDLATGDNVEHRGGRDGRRGGSVGHGSGLVDD